MTIKDAANRIAAIEGCDIILLNAGISRATESRVASLLRKRTNKQKKVISILCTEGGDPDAAFRIGRYLQDAYADLEVAVAGWCKSAGTLICISGNRLIMGPNGELGPLDVQLAKPDDLGGLSSGLTLDSAFRSLKAIGFDIFEHFLLETITKSHGRITTKTAAQIAAQISSGLMSPIFEQIDPIKIGEDFRATRIAEEYAGRLNLKFRNLIIKNDFNAMEALVRGYPSHGFVIDQTEAESLFHRVGKLSKEMQELVDELKGLATQPQSSLREETEIVTYLNDDGSQNAPTQPSQTPSSGSSPAGTGTTNPGGSGGHVPTATPAGARQLPVSAKRGRARPKTG